LTPVTGIASSAGLNELPVRAWQAVAEMRDTSPRIASLQDRPFPSRTVMAVIGKASMFSAPETLSLTPVTFNLANPVLHPQAGV
jgi:hypothetical protein